MNRRRLTVAGLLGLSLGLAACSPKESAAPAAPKRSPSVEIVAAEGRGLTVGAMMSTQAVYVLFDTQCPHCARLWEASVPLQKKAKFIWIPVGLLNAASSAQGAALLAAADPAQAMAEHEKSMLAGQGGISAPSSLPAELQEALKSNTRLFNNLGLESVPFTITRNARSGMTVSRSGSMDTATLAELIGVDAP